MADVTDPVQELRQHIEVLIAGARRSPKIISPKYGQFEPISSTVTKGQVLDALKALRRHAPPEQKGER